MKNIFFEISSLFCMAAVLSPFFESRLPSQYCRQTGCDQKKDHCFNRKNTEQCRPQQYCLKSEIQDTRAEIGHIDITQ